MGILNFQQLNEEIRDYHANRSDLTDDMIYRTIDLAQYRIARSHDWSCLKQTVLGTLSVSSPDTQANRRIDRILEVVPSETYQLKAFYGIKLKDASSGRTVHLDGLVHTVFDERYPDPDQFSRAMPTAYTYFDTRTSSGDSPLSNTLEFNVAPDLAYVYQARLQVFPRKVSDNTLSYGDNSDLDSHDDAIVNLAVSIIYQKFGRTDKAKEFFGIYSSMLDELINQDKRRINTGISLETNQGVPSNYWADPFVRSAR